MKLLSESSRYGYLPADCEMMFLVENGKLHDLQLRTSGSMFAAEQAFKAGDVDLPTEGNIAPMHAITLPDNFNNLDFGLNGPSFTLE